MKKTVLIFIFFSIFSSLWAYSLQDLKTAINQNNPDLLKLNEEYAQSLLDVKDAKAGYMPAIDFQFSGTYMLNVPVDAVYLNVDDIVNSIQWPSDIKPSTGGQRIKIYDGMENTFYNFGITMQQPLWTWGKIGNAVKLYEQISVTKLMQIENQQRQMESELETRLISLSYLSRVVDILEEEKVYAERLVQVSENAEKSGMLLHQDVVDARIQAKELEIAQNDVTEQITNQLIEICRITGIENLKLEDIEYNLDEEKVVSILEEDKQIIEAKALDQNQSSLKMISQLKLVNDIAVKIAKGFENGKPDIAMQLSASYGGSRFPLIEPNWLRKDSWNANISIGIKTTVWDGGKKANDVARKQSMAAVTDLQEADAKATIRQTLNSQWNTAEVCTMRIEYQDLKIESADAKILQKQKIFQTGYGSETDVLSAKIERCNALLEKERQSLNRAVACMTISFLSDY